MKFWEFKALAATETAPESVELRISGDIVSDDDAWFYEWLGKACASPNAFKTELAQHAGKPIDVWIDSYGGDFFAGAGIYNALKEHSRRGGAVNIKIDGKAMSAASMIAMAGDKIEMSPVAVIMIHKAWTYMQGNANELRHEADVLDTVNDALANAYQLKTGKSKAKILEMMDEESWMSAKQAQKEGFSDGTLYTAPDATQEPVAASYNRRMIAASTSTALRKVFEIGNKPPPEPDQTETLKAKLALATAGRFFN
jgi:ATP-dependent Clp protease, protease subunit